MSNTIKLSSATVDCPDAAALATFYAEITGGTVTTAPGWASVEGPNGQIDFHEVPDHCPPTWPVGPVPQQLHLDFFVDDLDATERRVLAAGAIRYEFQPNDDHCYVYADPAGHPFCLSTWGDPDGAQASQQPSKRTVKLLDHLEGQRKHVLGILEGLDDDQLRRPMLPSGWSCLSLVRHLAIDVERFWFRAVTAGETVDLPDDAWQVGPESSSESILALYRDEISRANTIIEATPLESAPEWWPVGLFGTWTIEDLEEILLHVIAETANHAGHLDAVRELIDGRLWLVLTD